MGVPSVTFFPDLTEVHMYENRIETAGDTCVVHSGDLNWLTTQAARLRGEGWKPQGDVITIPPYFSKTANTHYESPMYKQPMVRDSEAKQ